MRAVRALRFATCAGLAFLGAVVPVLAHAQPSATDRAPLPEPLLAETVTDIDGTDPGEVEVEVNGSDRLAPRGSARALDASLELEWLVTRAWGLRVEPSIGREEPGGASPASTHASTQLGANAGVSFKLLQDFAHDLHVDVEALGRAPWDTQGSAQPGDPAQPLALDLRAAARPGVVTLRASLGFGAFGTGVRNPLRASLAALLPFEPSGRIGFWGFEVDADGGRRAPLIASFEIVPNLTPAGLPLRLGVALPVGIGDDPTRPSFGLMLRLFYESEREIAFARPPCPSSADGR